MAIKRSALGKGLGALITENTRVDISTYPQVMSKI